MVWGPGKFCDILPFRSSKIKNRKNEKKKNVPRGSGENHVVQ